MAERGWVNRNLDWLVALTPCAAALAIGALTAILTALTGEWALLYGGYCLLARRTSASVLLVDGQYD